MMSLPRIRAPVNVYNEPNSPPIGAPPVWSNEQNEAIENNIRKRSIENFKKRRFTNRWREATSAAREARTARTRRAQGLARMIFNKRARLNNMKRRVSNRTRRRIPQTVMEEEENEF